jgi:Histidine phosphatase superfamily (branch 1)
MGRTFPLEGATSHTICEAQHRRATSEPFPAMGPPAITRRRRPFLTPLWLTLLGALAVLGVGLFLHQSASNTIVVIVPPASKELGTIDDPPLSATGEQQAQQLAQQFAAASGPDGLTAIYVDGSRSARQTVAPLAQLLGKQPVALTSSDAGGIAGQIMGEHGGDNVLVVCPEAVIPDLIQELSGQQTKSPEGDRAAWVVSVPSYGPASVLRLGY